MRSNLGQCLTGQLPGRSRGRFHISYLCVYQDFGSRPPPGSITITLKKGIGGPTVRRVAPRKLTCRALLMVLICSLASGVVITVHAGLRGPGKYCGVIVFDRWDTCFLLSGHFITYISDDAKNELRPYVGKAMQIDALKVSQPLNPGDALVRKYQIIGPAPDNYNWVTLGGLELVAQSDFGPQGTATFLIELRNAGNKPAKVNSSEFGPTLLGLSRKGPFCVSDGKSEAWFTRVNLVNSSSWESGSGSATYSASYIIDPKSRPPERFQLDPGKSVKVRVTFKVPAGQYQFMVGYGGGVHEEKSVASNAISFDLNDAGIATLAKPDISTAR